MALEWPWTPDVRAQNLLENNNALQKTDRQTRRQPSVWVSRWKAKRKVVVVVQCREPWLGRLKIQAVSPNRSNSTGTLPSPQKDGEKQETAQHL